MCFEEGDGGGLSGNTRVQSPWRIEMSDLWMNIRFGVRHLQVSRRGITFSVNQYHVENKPDRWFQVYR